MVIEDMQERLNALQKRLQANIEDILDNGENARLEIMKNGVYNGIYSSECVEYMKKYSNAVELKELLSSLGNVNHELIQDLTTRMLGFPIEEYEEMERINDINREYVEEFEYAISLFRNFTVKNFLGQKLQEDLPEKTQNRHRNSAKNELLAISRENLTIEVILNLIERLEIVIEDYMYAAHYYREYRVPSGEKHHYKA